MEVAIAYVCFWYWLWRLKDCTTIPGSEGA